MKTVHPIKLSTGKVMKPGGFRTAFDSLPYNSISKSREEICKICYWGLSTFKIKINGTRPFRIYEVEKLTQFFSEKGIDAWTGEPINLK